MRIHITNCKYCIRDKKHCDYYSNLMGKGLGILKGFHFNHNCLEYGDIFREGDLVEIDINNQVKVYPGILGEWNKEWSRYESNPVRGNISHCKSNNFYVITFLQPISLIRVIDGLEKSVEFENYAKYAKDIKLIKRADCKNRFEMIDFES